MKRELHFSIQGEIEMKETLNFTLAVNPATQPPNPLVVKDSSGNVLPDGATVPLVAETLGVIDPGQELFVVSGGVPPYNFAIASGAPPQGTDLNSTINSDGSETVTLAGTPTVVGESDFSIAVSDSAAPVANTRTLGTRRVG